MLKRAGLLFVMAVIQCLSTAQAQSFPNIKSCGLDFWNNATAAKDYALGVAEEKLSTENRNLIGKVIREKGITSALMFIQSAYVECVRPFNSTMSKADPFAICANQSATRHFVLQGIESNVSIEQRKSSMPLGLHPMIEVLYRRFEAKGFAGAVAFSVLSSKDCISTAAKVVP